MNIGNTIARGAAWMVGFKLLERSLGVLSTLILARLLLPADFGVVAMAMAFVALLELLTAFNFDVALIQKQTSERTAFDTAWTFNVLFGLLVAVLMLALSWPAARFYAHPELVPVVCVLAIGSAVQGFENIGVVAFRQELRFDREFRFLLGKKLIMFFTTVPLAFVLRSYWALVAGIVTGRIAGVALSYYVHPFRPRFSLKARHELMHFSKWLIGLNLLGFLKERSADLIIGRTLGAHSLGLFSVSYEISNMPATELVAPINRAVFPVYAKIGKDRAQLGREYLSVMAMIVLLAVPAVAGIASIASLLVPVVLGPHWLDAIPVLSLLAFFGITQVMQSNAYAVYLAIGRPDLQVKLTVAHVLVLIASLVTLISWRGVQGAAEAFLITALIILPVSFGLILSKLDLKVTALLDRLWRPILASTVMFFAVRAFVLDHPAQGPVTIGTVLYLLAAVALGAVIYVACVAVLWILAGRPEGAEAVIARRLARLISFPSLKNTP
jgi:lipopolysaccharide exporter